MARKKRKTPKVALALLLVALIGIGACLYTWQQQPPANSIVVEPWLEITYADGTTEIIRPTLLPRPILLSVTYAGKEITGLAQYFDIVATVEDKSGTIAYSLSYIVTVGTTTVNSGSWTKTANLGAVLTTSFGFYPAKEVESKVGPGTYTIKFALSGSGTATTPIDGKTYTGTLSGTTSYSITVTAPTLTIIVTPRSVDTFTLELIPR